MGLGSWGHWLIVLVVVVLIFGTARLKNVGKDLGEAVKGFKKGIRDDQPNAQLRDERRDEADTTTNRDTSDVDRDRR